MDTNAVDWVILSNIYMCQFVMILEGKLMDVSGKESLLPSSPIWDKANQLGIWTSDPRWISSQHFYLCYNLREIGYTNWLITLPTNLLHCSITKKHLFVTKLKFINRSCRKERSLRVTKFISMNRGALGNCFFGLHVKEKFLAFPSEKHERTTAINDNIIT